MRHSFTAVCGLIALGGSTVLAPLPLPAQAPEEVSVEQVRQVVEHTPRTHPRLLLNDAALAGLKHRVQHDPRARELYQAMYRQAERMLEIPPVQHIVTGRRLLGESRKAVRRVLTLALVQRLSGEERFLEAARREMLAAAAFPDWNPSHFLDTAEMSFALAVGYDWLFHDLSPQDRATIREALLEKGLEASFEHDHWVRATSNWGQVCHAGITAAALALLEDHPELATRVVHRAVTNVPLSMHAFAPDGTYPEGPSYWSYGTSFNVILLGELRSALGTDFGLTGEEGFSETASFINHATGPSLLFFNYADGSSTRGPLPVLNWFARHYSRPDWLLFENTILRDHLRSDRLLEVADGEHRLLPLALVWLPEATHPHEVQMGLHWLGKGEIPVAMHRTSWTDPTALYFGIKAGRASGPHGQMDAGSFVLDADGVRWGMDLGFEDYHRIESRGMNLWDRAQESDRWKVFRNNNLSHSTLVIGGQHHVVTGHAPIIRHSEGPSFPHTVVDLSEVYAGQASRVLRGMGLLNGSQVIVRDRLEGVANRKPVRWGMLTPAEVEIRGPREAVLRQGESQLTLRVVQPTSAQLQIFETEQPPNEWDSPNPGTRMVGFMTTPKGGAPLDLVVLLTPRSTKAEGSTTMVAKPLQEW